MFVAQVQPQDVNKFKQYSSNYHTIYIVHCFIKNDITTKANTNQMFHARAVYAYHCSCRH